MPFVMSSTDLVCLNPRVKVLAIKPHTLNAYRYLGDIWAYFAFKDIARHAEIGGRIAVPENARRQTHIIGTDSFRSIFEYLRSK